MIGRAGQSVGGAGPTVARRKTCDICGYGVADLRRHEKTLRHQIRELGGGRGMWVADMVPFDGELAAAGVEVVEKQVELFGGQQPIRLVPEWAAAFAIIVQAAFADKDGAKAFIAGKLPELKDILEFLWRVGERDMFHAVVWAELTAGRNSDTRTPEP